MAPPRPPAGRSHGDRREQARRADLAARARPPRAATAWCPAMLRQLGVPESRQRIFQSDAGRARGDQAHRRHRAGACASRWPATWPPGGWSCSRGRPARPGPLGGDRAAGTQPDPGRPPSCCGSSPPRGRHRRWCAAPASTPGGSSRRCTSRSGASGAAPRQDRVERLGHRRGPCARAGTRRRTAAPRPSTRPAARTRARPPAG